MTRSYQTIRRYALVFFVLGVVIGLYALWADLYHPEEGVNAAGTSRKAMAFGPFKMGKAFPITRHEEKESHYPVVAWTGSDYFVAYQTNLRGEFDIDGRFVSREGKPMGKTGFPVSAAQGDQYFASVVWGKGEGLVVWEDHRDRDPGIYAARIGGNRKVRDESGIPIAVGPEFRQYPRAAWDGRQYLVVWEEERPAPQKVDILGVRVSVEGKVLDPAPLALGTHGGNQFWSAVATDGSQFLVVWTDQRHGGYDIYGTRVDGSGKVLDPDGIPISRATGNQEYPHAAWDGSRFWVVWADHRQEDSVAVYGARVGGDGKVQDPSGILLSRESGRHSFPSILPLKSDRSLVMWEEDTENGRDLLGSLVDGSGKVSLTNRIPLAVHPGVKHPLRADRDQDRILLVWQDKRTAGGANVFGRVLSFSFPFRE